MFIQWGLDHKHNSIVYMSLSIATQCKLVDTKPMMHVEVIVQFEQAVNTTQLKQFIRCGLTVL